MILTTITQKVDPNDAILGFYVEWIERMARRADRVHVIALEKGEYEPPSNLEVFSLGKEDGAGSLAMLLELNRILWRLCRGCKPDAILVHMVPRYVLYALPVALLFRVPVDLWYTHKGVDKYLRMAHPFIRHAFTASEESFRLSSGKKAIVGHGIDTSRFEPGREARRSGVLTVGRITPSKDQKVLVEALGILNREREGDGIEARIVGEPLLAGDMAYMDELKKLVQERGLELVVRMEGPIPHSRLPEAYRAAEIMVNASHTGSVDKVVLEAMATGAIPLTCNESFVPLLGDMAESLVFRKGDADDLAARIQSIFEMNRSERDSLAARLREIVVKNHNLDRLMDRMVGKMGDG